MFSAEGAVGETVKVWPPGVVSSPFAAVSTLLAIRPVDGKSSQNAHLAAVVAVWTLYSRVVDLAAAFLAASQG